MARGQAAPTAPTLFRSPFAGLVLQDEGGVWAEFVGGELVTADPEQSARLSACSHEYVELVGDYVAPEVPAEPEPVAEDVEPAEGDVVEPAES